MIHINLIKNQRLKKYLKEWKKYNYENSLDAYFAKIIADITNLEEKDIIIWYADKHNSNDFNYFKFEYQKKYYELDNNNIREISEKEIFKKNKNKIT